MANGLRGLRTCGTAHIAAGWGALVIRWARRHRGAGTGLAWSMARDSPASN